MEVTDTEAMITGLTNGTEYEVRVRAHNAETDGDGEWSDKEKATPMAAPEPLATPTVTIETITHDSIMISWGPVEGAEEHTVSWDTVGGFLLSADVGANTGSYTIPGLIPETAYSVSVCATAEGLMDGCSESMTATTMPAPMPEPRARARARAHAHARSAALRSAGLGRGVGGGRPESPAGAAASEEVADLRSAFSDGIIHGTGAG